MIPKRNDNGIRLMFAYIYTGITGQTVEIVRLYSLIYVSTNKRPNLLISYENT